MMDKAQLALELKQLIIETLKLEDIKPEDINDSAPLFGEGLGLDSIDALELVVAIEKRYGIKIADQNEGKEAFGSVDNLVDFVLKNKN